MQKAREHELKLFQMMLPRGNWQESPQGHNRVPSHDYFHPHTFGAHHGNQHTGTYQDFHNQQEYLFVPVPPAMSRPTSALSNDSSSSSASHDMSSDNVFY